MNKKLNICVWAILLELAFTSKAFSSRLSLPDHKFSNFMIDSSAIKAGYLKSKNYLIFSDSIIFGVNGHPLTQQAYLENDLDTQIKFIKELNLKNYRIDVLLSNAGKIHNELRFHELISKAKKNNVVLLPVLINTNWEKKIQPQDCYALGKMLGQEFALKYKRFFKQYELGNEDDSKLVDPKVDGSLEEHYDSTKLSNLISYYKGMIAGLTSVDKDAEIIISSSGWLHTAYFKLLNKAKVKYDIIGYHWYSDMGDLTNNNFNILDSLGLFNKPIWFTEINRRNGSKEGNYTSNTSFKESGSKQLAQFQWFKRYIEQISSRNYVHAVFIYELYDQPAFDDKKGFDAPNEAYFGLLQWLISYSVPQRKIAFYQLKSKLNEVHYGMQDFISMLYLDFTNYLPTEKEYDQSINLILKVQDFALFVENFAHKYVLKKLILDKYNLLLNRDPYTHELEYWSKSAIADNIIEQLILEITLSEEFWNLAGKSEEGFIKALYWKMHQREVDLLGEKYWLNLLQHKSDRKLIVESILHSNEYITNVIVNDYEKLLHKNIDPLFYNYKLQTIRGSFSEYKYFLYIISSRDYWIKALNLGCEKRKTSACCYD